MAYRYLSEVAALPTEQRAEAYRELVSTNEWIQDTLANRISAGVEVSDDEARELTAIFGKRCTAGKKGRLYWAFRACPNMKSYGIYSRIMFERDGTIHYCAGQSYPDEIRTVRECLVGR